MAYVDGQFGTWKPIGAEATSGGYLVAWKNSIADQYMVWSTDSNANYVNNITGLVAGSDAGLQAMETTSQQALGRGRAVASALSHLVVPAQRF